MKYNAGNSRVQLFPASSSKKDDYFFHSPWILQYSRATSPGWFGT